MKTLKRLLLLVVGSFSVICLVGLIYFTFLSPHPIDIGKFFRQYDRERREKIIQSVSLPSDSIGIAIKKEFDKGEWTNPDTGEKVRCRSIPEEKPRYDWVNPDTLK